MNDSSWLVHEAQQDGIGGKAHRYIIPFGVSFCRRFCNHQWVDAAALLHPASAAWPHCRRCEKLAEEEQLYDES